MKKVAGFVKNWQSFGERLDLQNLTTMVDKLLLVEWKQQVMLFPIRDCKYKPRVLVVSVRVSNVGHRPSPAI